MTTLESRADALSPDERLRAKGLRRRGMTAASLGLCVVVGGSAVLRAWLDTTITNAVIASAVFVATMTIVVAKIAAYHPFPHLGPANQVTIVRALLVAVVGSLVIEPARPEIAWTAVVTTAVIAILDGVDGWLARRSAMASAFGARFDMETDAFFMLVLSVLVWQHNKAGAWVIGIGLMRYAFVVAGWMLPWLAAPFRATWRGKTIAVAQLVALAFALVPQVSRDATRIVCAVALATLAWSFAIDIMNLWRHRRQT
jgi:phosphatidylglycerophosphate synthase